MDSVEKQLLYCLEAYRLGRPAAKVVPGLGAEDWHRLRMLAGTHKMGPMVFETLWSTQGFCGTDKGLAAAWRRDTMLQAAGQTMCSSRIVAITAALEEAGVPYALLKGLVCRELYTRPDLRPSGDEDVLIRPADRQKCQEVLQQCGLQMVMGDENVTHWRDSLSGLHIELHSRLLSGAHPEEEELNARMMQQLDHTVTVPVSGGTVQSLAPTWHFVFLVCHALKHFLTGGVGVRTLCDVVSFAEHYKDEIDVPTVEKMLEGIHGRVFLDQILAMGQIWLSFDPAAAGWTYSGRPDPDSMIEDCLDAGVYGQSSMSRKHSAELVLQATDSGSTHVRLGSVLFPARKDMLRRYPELERWPVLLPVCWCRRLGTYAGEVLRSKGDGNSPLESVTMGRKRARMMQKYGIDFKK